MAKSNAGIGRNRLATGVKGVEREIILSPEVAASIDAARVVNGKTISTSRYLELLVRQFVSERGALPVLSPSLDGTEVEHSTAA